MPPKPTHQHRNTQRRSRSLDKCHLCNNLDPRGHVLSQQNVRDARAIATLTCGVRELAGVSTFDRAACRFCVLLVKALDAVVEGWRGKRDGKVVLGLGMKEVVRVEVFVDGEGWDGVEVFCAVGDPSPWPALGLGIKLPPSSDSEKSLEFAQRAIQHCDESPDHALCRPRSRFRPSRLIDVGSIKSDAVKVVTSRYQQPVKYAALSHCWGKSPTLTTTSATLKQHCNNIDLVALPPLFQDAVTMTRNLGLQYLWIDSLCILQDCRSDWESQSVMMPQIYDNAYITIAATSARSSAGRLFEPLAARRSIKYHNTTGKAFRVQARRIPAHHLRGPEMEADNAFRVRGPLTSRAWVLQEQVLSSRVLHFAPGEMVFECRAGRQCQCRPISKAVTTPMGWVAKTAAAKPAKVYAMWHRLVEDYCSRQLSISTDTLPAISGIAAKFGDLTGSEYLAGLWRENLGADLLWSVKWTTTSPTPAPNPATAAAQYLAPSFSWASTQREIHFETPWDRHITTKDLFTLKSGATVPLGSNKFGEVKDGHITLHGPVTKAMLLVPSAPSAAAAPEAQPAYRLKLATSQQALSMTPDTQLVESASTPVTVQRSSTDHDADAATARDAFSAQVLCLFVRAASDGSVSGLVLGGARTGGGAYERLGVFSCGREGMLGSRGEEVRIV